MTDAFKYDVFLSHSAKHEPVMRPLAEQLWWDGRKARFAESVLKPGDSILAKIKEEPEHSRVLVFCLSPTALGSDFVGLEHCTIGKSNLPFRDPAIAGGHFIPQPRQFR
jgi:hypothetical protein